MLSYATLALHSLRALQSFPPLVHKKDATDRQRIGAQARWKDSVARRCHGPWLAFFSGEYWNRFRKLTPLHSLTFSLQDDAILLVGGCELEQFFFSRQILPKATNLCLALAPPRCGGTSRTTFITIAQLPYDHHYYCSAGQIC